MATTGNDTSVGSVTAPFRTIKQASRMVKPGDDVVVRGGVYTEATSISSKGTASARIVFRTAPGEHVILDGSHLPAGTDLLTLNAAEYVDVAGFEIRNSPKSGLVLWHAKSVRVLDNHIHHTYLNGIYVGGSSTPSCTDITISGNSVHDTALENQYHTRTSGGWPGAVVVSRTDNAIISANRIYNNDGEGLISLRSNSHLVEGNEISDNYSMNLYVDNARMITANGNLIHSSNPRYFRNGKPAAGIGVANETKDVPLPSSDNTFTNNIVIGTRWGFYYGNYEAGGGLKNTKVVNNTFYGTVDAIIHVDAGAHSTSVVQNNIFHPTASPNPSSTGAGAGVSYANNLWYGGNAGAAAGAGDVIANPMFANPGGRTAADYKVRAGSAAIAKAANVGALVQADFFGAARVVPFDIGAHQFSTTAKDADAPSRPENLRATGGDNSSVTLTWDASTDNVGVSGYSIVRNGATVATITSGTTWTDRSVASKTVYLYQVIAHDAAGNRSAPSVVLSIAWRSSEAETPAPDAPIVISPRRSATTISLQWNVVENATAFKIYRDGVEIAATPWFDFTDQNLAPSTVYTYTLVAVDKDGKISPTSNSVSVKTQPGGKSRAARH
ncbi:MAG TPA: right-handed parallel beta-helix repeat-containing protein [Thermoanaerobaculia bacterium]|nr:right-handed parallel beta-helix repeat-containing protein [Thermoanaerobaculia bacterium]